MKTYSTPLTDEQFKELSISGVIRKQPSNFHLIDVLREMKWGRPANDQKFIDRCIKKIRREKL